MIKVVYEKQNAAGTDWAMRRPALVYSVPRVGEYVLIGSDVHKVRRVLHSDGEVCVEVGTPLSFGPHLRITSGVSRFRAWRRVWRYCARCDGTKIAAACLFSAACAFPLGLIGAPLAVVLLVVAIIFALVFAAG